MGALTRRVGADGRPARAPSAPARRHFRGYGRLGVVRTREYLARVMSYATDMPTVEKVARTDAGLASELRLSVMRLRRRLADERHPDNELSLGAMAVLGALYRNGDLTVGELAAHEHVQPPSMTRTVNCLERGRLRHPPPARHRRPAGPGRALRERPGQRARRPGPARRLARDPAARPHPRGARRAATRRADPRSPRPEGLTTATVSPTFRALRNPNYRRYLAGSVVSNTGTWMQRVAQDWLVLQLPGNSGTALGITTGLQFLPGAAALAVRRGDRRPLPQAPPAPAHPGDDGGRLAAARPARRHSGSPRPGTST